MSLVGERIRELRTQAGWSQAALAEEAGFKNGSTIGNYEQGNNAVSIDAATAIARALKPAIGDHLVYLLIGERPEEYNNRMLERNEQDYLHVTQISDVLTKVLVNASSLGLIKLPKAENKRLSIISSMIESFNKEAKR